MTVAALYVEARGIYPTLTPHWFDLAKGARTYDGPYPVVAHPPCAPWSRLRAFSNGNGKDCGPIAVEQVRKYGGVLEHPASSSLFQHCNLPRVGGTQRDSFGGWSFCIDQFTFGHPAPKRTWLYIVGCAPRDIPVFPLELGAAQGRVMHISKRARIATPPAFAHWLLDLAASCKVAA